MTGAHAVLVTGGTGFLGAAIVRVLTERGHRVLVLARRRPDATARVAGAEYAQGSVLDQHAVEGILRRFRPDDVVHAAGLASPFADLGDLLEANVVGTARLLAAVDESKSASSMFLASSSAVYERDAPSPIAETAPLRPTSAYGISKFAQELVATAEERARVAVLRYFNLVGAGQSPDLALSAFCRRIAEAERSGSSVLRVGRLDTRRDLIDVADAARATVSALEGEVFEVLNVASGVDRSMADCLDQLVALARVPLDVAADPALHRPTDVLSQRGDPTKLMTLTSWRPVIPFEETARNLLQAWRERIGP